MQFFGTGGRNIWCSGNKQRRFRRTAEGVAVAATPTRDKPVHRVLGLPRFDGQHTPGVILGRASVLTFADPIADSVALVACRPRRCSRESPALDRHFRYTVAVSALRVPDFGGIHGSAGLLPLVCLRSRPLGVARRRAVASIRGGSGGVGPDVGEHAAAVPAREGPYQP
jgi:hypothetical protein